MLLQQKMMTINPNSSTNSTGQVHYPFPCAVSLGTDRPPGSPMSMSEMRNALGVNGMNQRNGGVLGGYPQELVMPSFFQFPARQSTLCEPQLHQEDNAASYMFRPPPPPPSLHMFPPGMNFPQLYFYPPSPQQQPVQSNYLQNPSAAQVALKQMEWLASTRASNNRLSTLAFASDRVDGKQFDTTQLPSQPQRPDITSEISRKRASSSSYDDEHEPNDHPHKRLVTATMSSRSLNSTEDNSEMGLGGESRLKISFSNLGSPGRYPQVFGKSRLGVPHGLSGTYVLYSERWRSEIIHDENSFESEDGTHHVLVTWKITNLSSGETQSRTETPKEALLRHKDGRTLCNKVFRRALEQRATELERDLLAETNPIRIRTMKNLIKKLRPKHFSEGPLVFGLRHECVQNRFKAGVAAMGSPRQRILSEPSA